MKVAVKTYYTDKEDVYENIESIKQKKDSLEIKRIKTELNNGYALDVEEVIKIPIGAIDHYKVNEF